MQHTYIIGEIGQNHNGSTELAKSIIDIASIEIKDEFSGVILKPLDAVKLTKRDLREELSASAMNKPYNNPNSFGNTYGEHREYLELSDEEHFEIYKHAKTKGLDFVETLCSPGTLSILNYFTPDRLKVASRDLTNIPLLEVMAETKIPIILSTGMGGQKELDDALKIITKHHSNISILHCLSEYPAHYINLNLRTIDFLKEKYPNYTVGYSDHSVGISIPIAAVAMGAQVVEKHITLDRRLKGTDHKGSLGIDGLNRMVRDIRNLERAFGEKTIFTSKASKTAKVKLERSIASKRSIKKGEKITEKDIHLLSPGDGFKFIEKDKVIGKEAIQDIPMDEIIYSQMIK